MEQMSLARSRSFQQEKKILNAALLSVIFLISAAAFSAAANAQPYIQSVYPLDGIGAAAINTTVNATINYTDANATNLPFNVRFYWFNGTSWVSFANYVNVTNGTYSASGQGRFTQPMTKYFWRLEVTDSNGTIINNTYNFTTRGLLKVKFNTNVGASTGKGERQLLPVMGDIDSDGTQEIVLMAGGNVVAVNGKTGQVEWSVPGYEGNAVELADLDKDGEPEVLAVLSSPNMRIRALDGDGSTVWTSLTLSGEHTPMFPLLAFDTDGDGYPTIYFAGQDAHPDPFSGNISEYEGALSMLDHNGNILLETWIQKPCWGGFSMADYDYDGKFELYMSERRDAFHDLPAKGLQAFDADTLELIWSRPDLQHSSPMAVIADVLGDGRLEVIATQITLRGPLVLDPANGESMKDYQNRGLPTHTSPTVYDIDGDGNKEAIYATSYPSNAPKNFVVFDLVTGTTDFIQTLEAHSTWSPRAGDVTGDGVMEILVSLGEQMNYWDSYPLLVYNNNYELIDRVDIPGDGQLGPARLYDTDDDGLFEVVMGSANGRLIVLDTPSPVPNPAPRTWIQDYSEYRAGAAEFIDTPGPAAPLAMNISPVNNSENLTLDITLSAFIKDFHGDRFDVVIDFNDGPGWQTLATWTNVSDGVYGVSAPSELLDYSSQYFWRITTTDEVGNTITKTMSFETMGGNTTKPIISDENPADGTVNVSMNLTHLNFSLFDSNGEFMSYVVTTIPNIGSANVTNVTNGSYSVAVSGLESEKDYTWQVIATDGIETSYKTYTFRTEKIRLPLLNDTFFEDSSDSSDLAANSVWQDWYESRGQNPTLVSLNTDSVGSNTGKKARFGGTNASSDNAYLSQEFVEPQKRNFSVEWDIYVDEILNITQPDRTGSMFIGDDSGGTNGPSSSSSERFMHMAFERDGGAADGTADIIALNRSNAKVIVAENVTLDEWHRIRVDVNVSGGSYDVYVDGEFKASVTSRTAKTEVTHISLAQTSDGAGTFYADNVREFAEEVPCVDDDADGYYTSPLCGPLDCDDTNASVNPGATEMCDGIDNDCDAMIDEGLLNTYYADVDVDTYGTPLNMTMMCTPPAGFVDNDLDCEDGNATINPAATEICDAVDNDCDGEVDEGCFVEPWLDGWLYRKSVTINSSLVNGIHSGFAVLVDVTDTDLASNAQSGGEDIVFTSDDGETVLDFEMESYNSGHIVAWVETDISDSADTMLFMYYGNNNATSMQNAAGVWDASYKAVYHMDSSASSIPDSTSNANSGSLLNGASEVAGMTGSAISFDGSDDRASLPKLFSSESAFTFEAWSNSASRQGYIISQRNTLSQGAFMQYYPPEGNYQMYVNTRILRVPATSGDWHYVVGTFDGATASLYVDAGTPASGSATVTWPDLVTLLGDRSSLGRAFQGTLDEIRVSSSARGSNYIATVHSNRVDQDSFISLGLQETNS